MRPSGSRRVLLGLVPVFAFACKGPPPDQVRLELPDRILSADPARATVHLRRAGASSVSTERMEWHVTPPDLATVTPDGTLTCQKSGDAQVEVSVQGVKDKQVLKCRLVERVDVGTLPPFDITKPPVTVTAHALSRNGKELDDVPITLQSDSPRVLTVAGATLTPNAVGETSLTVQAGAKQQKVPIRVVRSITAEALPLEGGRRIYYSLPDGKFEVEVTLPLEHDLSVEWRGAPYCAYKGHAQVHHSTCVLQNKGGAVVDNPAFLIRGDTAVTGAGVSIREVP
ncbi:MAG TPA: hypothetical protein VGQ57_13560 [Polyangiaceae bacterium]|jgi:hypothetical protein|nr:hypothetical protein [Polyangiaceae bacterium]